MIKNSKFSYLWGIYILLIELCMGLYLGPLPLSEYILWSYAVININNLLSKNKSYLYSLLIKIIIPLFFIQLFIDIFIYKIDIFYIIKGSDNILMALVHTYFLYKQFKSNQKYIYFALVGLLLGYIFFGASSMEIDDTNLTSVLEGENAPFLKFVIAPAVSSFLLLISFLTFFRNKIVLLFIITGTIFIFLGARSSGMMLILASIITYSRNIPVLKKRGFISFVSILLCLYLIYCVYVNYVLNGVITAGNNTQLLELHNPYNPIELLLSSRPTTYIPWVAMWESPLFGFSTLKESEGIYLDLSVIDPMMNNFKVTQIPCHSIIMYFGVCYGLISLLLITFFIIIFISKSFKLMYKQQKTYNLVIGYIIVFTIWNMLFSPPGHFKWTFPIYFAIIMFIENKLNKIAIK